MRITAFFCLWCLALAAPGRGASLPASPPGIGAWAYGYDTGTVAALTAYDAGAASTAQLQYLFPDFGSINIGPNAPAVSVSLYYPSSPNPLTQYKAALPSNVLMMPIFESNGSPYAGDFSGWNAADTSNAADIVAAAVTAAAATPGQGFSGVSFDLEPFSSIDLVFYARVTQDLNAAGILVAFYANSVSSLEYGGLPAGNIFLFSGYDLGLAGHDIAESPAAYGTAMQAQVAQSLAQAQAAGNKVLVGVPMAAANDEYETSYNCAEGEVSGFLQSDYINQAATVLCQDKSNPALLGASVWGLGPGMTGRYGGCNYTPVTPPAYCWSALQTYAVMNCGPTATPLPTATVTPNGTPATPTPAGGGAQGPPVVETGVSVPNPAVGGTWNLALKLSAPADQLDIRIFTKSFMLAAHPIFNGSWPAGWTRQSLPVHLAPGLYYVMVRAGLSGASGGPGGAIKVFALP